MPRKPPTPKEPPAEESETDSLVSAEHLILAMSYWEDPPPTTPGPGGDNLRAQLHAAVDRLLEWPTGGAARHEHSEAIIDDIGLFLQTAMPAIDIEIGRRLAGHLRRFRGANDGHFAKSSVAARSSAQLDHGAHSKRDVESWAQIGRRFRADFAQLEVQEQITGLIEMLNLVGRISSYDPFEHLATSLQAQRVGIDVPVFAPVSNVHGGQAAHALRLAKLAGLASGEYLFHSGALHSRAKMEELLSQCFATTGKRVQKWTKELIRDLGAGFVSLIIDRAIDAGRFARMHDVGCTSRDTPEWDERLHVSVLYGRIALLHAAVNHRLYLNFRSSLRGAFERKDVIITKRSVEDVLLRLLSSDQI